MIIRVQANLWTAPVARSPHEVLQVAVQITQKLARMHPLLKGWYALPSSRKEKTLSLDDSEELLARMEREIEKRRKRFGDYAELGAYLSIANVDNDRDWRKPGVVVLQLDPSNGFNALSIEGAEPFGDAMPPLMLEALVELVKALRPTFACTSVKARTPEKGIVTYLLDRRLYQHRQFLGWMGFVPAQLTHPQIRDAHAVYPVDGLGMVIVSVPGVFDPCDDAQVDKVHRVEMDLASYDLLPVTDPNLMR